MARFDSMHELAEFLGCGLDDPGLPAIQALAKRVYFKSPNGSAHMCLEIDLTQARPIIREIKDRLRAAAEAQRLAAEEAAEAELYEQWREIKRHPRKYRPHEEQD